MGGASAAGPCEGPLQERMGAAMAYEEADKLIEDCQVLLRHVTRLPDSRLDWCFEDTRKSLAGTPPARIAVPPAATPGKGAFLERLVALACAPRAARGGPAPDPADMAFLIGARDFLSSLASPATVDSIRITEEYNRTGGLSRIGTAIRRVWQRLRRGTPLPAGTSSRTRSFGRSLATQVALANLLVLVVVSLTVVVSIYALVGRGLLQEVRANDAFFNQLSAEMEAAQQADAGIFAAVLGRGEDPPRQQSPFPVRRYCEFVQWKAKQGEHDAFASTSQQKLCDRYVGYNSTVTRLFVRLKDWHGVVVLPGTRDDLEGPAPAPGTVHLADASGGLPAGAADAARGAGEAGPSLRALALAQSLRLEVATANVVLQAIAEYLLPCLYAALGALAAALRHIARRADTSTLDFSDGGVIWRSLVLGVLFGAVIGLFASQIGGAITPEGEEAIASLTPAAISLLAGYSVARVFEFFDGLALRVFGAPAQAAGPAR